MIVPRFWAESRLQHRTTKRQVTLYRFGWSNVSAEAAQQLAEERVRTAMDRVLSGERLDFREHKVPYNGADGLPIREEILLEQGESVVTRNSYGARCLNTPHLLLADIDFAPSGATGRVQALSTLLTLAAAATVGVLSGSFLSGLAVGLGALLLGLLARPALRGLRAWLGSGDEQVALGRVRAFVQRHPDWRVHAYRTPAGLRLLVDHRRFDPVEPAVAGFFQDVGVDPMYRRMCTLQRCFRARLTAKPWRIGVEAHLKPRPGVWPVSPARLPERTRWVEGYEARAHGFSACRYLQTLGAGVPARDLQDARLLHDELSGAHSGRPIA